MRQSRDSLGRYQLDPFRSPPTALDRSGDGLRTWRTRRLRCLKLRSGPQNANKGFRYHAGPPLLTITCHSLFRAFPGCYLHRSVDILSSKVFERPCFFIESAFLGLFLFGEERLSRWGHWGGAFLAYLATPYCPGRQATCHFIGESGK